jgi:amino acid transporter
MGYASDPEKTIPQAIISCYVTIAAIAIMILISGSGITPFSILIDSEAPLMDGIDAVYGQSSFISDAVANLVVIGLLVNFFAFVVFSSQQMQAVASAGQLPAFLAYRDSTTGAPITASICSSTIGLVLTAGFALAFGESAAQDTLVTAALMPAILGYALLLQCIIRTRYVEARNLIGHTEENDAAILGRDPGPLRFYWGVPGARIAQLMCLVFVISLFVLAYVSRSFRWGLAVLGLILAILLIGNMRGFSFSSKTPRNPRAAHYGAVGDDIDQDEDLAALLSNTDAASDTHFLDFSPRRFQPNTIADPKYASI